MRSRFATVLRAHRSTSRDVNRCECGDPHSAEHVAFRLWLEVESELITHGPQPLSCGEYKAHGTVRYYCQLWRNHDGPHENRSFDHGPTPFHWISEVS